MSASQNGSAFTGTGSVNNGTYNISNVVVPSGNNQVLIVATATEQTTLTTTGVTWNSISLTALTSFNGTGGIADFVALWYLLNPTPATANAVITESGATNTSQGAFAFTLQGVNQTTPFGTPVTKTTTSTGNPISQAITGSIGDLFFDVYCDDNQSSSLSQQPASGQTRIATVAFGGGRVLLGSFLPGASSLNMGWRLTQNPEGSWILVDAQQAGIPIGWVT